MSQSDDVAYVCISCGSITDTKNLSLTAFAITAAADWKTAKENRVQPTGLSEAKTSFFGEKFFCCDRSGNTMKHQNTVSQL